MKSIMWVFAAVAACVVSRANADGVCYDPDHGNGAVTAGSIAADMNTIKSKGFSHVRTYISMYGGINVADIIAKSGLRATLGVPFGHGDIGAHVNAAVGAAQSGNVDYIMVGNENLDNQDFGQVGAMIAIINDIKGRVGGKAKVGTVQRTAEFDDRIRGLVGACDAIGVNIHPFFTPNQSPGKAIDNTNAQWKKAKDIAGGKLILTETGWPTSGNFAGSQGSYDAAKQYWNAYKSWSSFIPDSGKYYFQFFDTPQKGPEYEKTFGIYTTHGDSKVGAGGNPAPAPAPKPAPTPSTPAPTTPAPTTPAPTTPAPTTAVVANGTSSAIGDDHNGSGSGTSVNAGDEAGSSKKDTDLGIAGKNEAGEADLTPSPSEGTTTDGTIEAGDNNGAVETNTQASTSTSAAGVIVVALFGVGAVAAAFGFIYKARQKARALELSEQKESFDQLSMTTPGGACVL